MRSTAHLTDERLRKLLFRKMTPEEVERMRQIDRESAWLLELNLRALEDEDNKEKEDSDA